MGADGKLTWQCAVAIANITQGAHFSNVQTAVVPTLLRRSKLVDLIRRRIIFAAEHWVIQGFPHPAFEVVDGDMSRFFPCAALVMASPPANRTEDVASGDSPDSPARLLGGAARAARAPRTERLSSTAQRGLTSNSMHWAQVGVWFLCSLARAPWRGALDGV